MNVFKSSMEHLDNGEANEAAFKLAHLVTVKVVVPCIGAFIHI